MVGILTEAEREKLKTLTADDGTVSYSNEDIEQQDKKEMYLPVPEEKKSK